MLNSKSDPIAILGAGAFGLSTALELTERGYTNISVYEKDDEIPSRWSAANDLNKIVRPEYQDDYYTNLTVESMRKWQTSLFAPHFHRVGYLHCVSAKANEKAWKALRDFQEGGMRHPEISKSISNINTRKDIHDACWKLVGPMAGWKGYFNRYAGYGHSANALRAVYNVVRKRGVRFFLGAGEGEVSEIVYSGGKATGLKTKAGRRHAAALVIVTVGAAATQLVPQIGSQVVAKSWSVAHVRLTDDETARLRGIPVTYARDLGFLFEPDPKTNLLKICPMGGGYINTNTANGMSQPPQGVNRFLPQEDESRIRELLRQTLPWLAERPLVQKTLCWFADTVDSDYILDFVPNTSASVILFTGDSGHGFKMFPIAGQWVVDLLETSDSRQKESRWRWKEPKNNLTGNLQDVSWRVGDVRELREVEPVGGKSRL